VTRPTWRTGLGRHTGLGYLGNPVGVLSRSRTYPLREPVRLSRQASSARQSMHAPRDKARSLQVRNYGAISVIVETRRDSKVLKRIAETVTALDRTLGRVIGTGTAPDRTLHPSLTESF
jgi:hypothetical protein